MRNMFLLLALVITFSSCESDDVIDSETKPSYQFDFFSKKNMTFEWFYAYYNSPLYSDERKPIGTSDSTALNFDLIKDVNLEEKSYFVYSNTSFGKPIIYSNSTTNSFRPIRYEDGNYYGYVKYASSYTSDTLSKEIIFLKDNLQIGDSWTSNIELSGEDWTYTEYHLFELIDIMPIFSETGVEYKNVYKVRENLRPNKSYGYNLHYYSEEHGLLRSETAGIFNGFYGDIIFNRIN